MANERPSLKDFDPYTDRNGQDQGQDSPLDLAVPERTRHDLNSDPSWQAEVARIASGGPRLDSIEGGSIETSDATAAETPPEHIRRISDPSLGGDKSSLQPDRKAQDAVDRATAAVGHDTDDER
jgi:hypothetical protein